MAALTVLWCVVLFWTIVNLCRLALAYQWPERLNRLQQQQGITIGVLSLTWHTTRFNDCFNTFSPRKSLSQWQYWCYRRYFTVGVWLAMAMFPYAIFTIFNAISHSGGLFGRLLPTSKASGDEAAAAAASANANPGFMLVIPGVSIPFSECIYFFLAVAISSIIHELGHALAANRHNLHIEHVGISLFICLPMTFVSMQSTQQLKHGVWGKLEVVSAGLLNNAALCLVTLGCFLFNPLLLLYTSANGLIVASVDSQSSISSGPNALLPYSVIKSINGHRLNSLNQWTDRLSSIATQQHGLCVPADFLRKYQSSLSPPCNFDQCCATDERRLCFLLHTTAALEAAEHPESCDYESLLQSNLQPYVSQALRATELHSATDAKVIGRNFTAWHRKACLPARPVTEVATQFCTDNSHCMATYFGQPACLWPYSSQPQARLIVIEVESKQSNILFWGPAAELYQALSLSPIRPRLGIIPLMAIDQMNTFFRYLFSISFSIILFNLLPFDPFDGYHIFTLSSTYLVRGNARRRLLQLAHLTAAVIVLCCVLTAIIQLLQHHHVHQMSDLNDKTAQISAEQRRLLKQFIAKGVQHNASDQHD